MVDRAAGEEGPVTQFEAAHRGRLRRPRRGAGRGRGDRGRARRPLDATNVIPSQRHGAHLGRARAHRVAGGDLEEIAAEKLAVLRDHTTLVAGELPAEVEAGGRAGRSPSAHAEARWSRRRARDRAACPATSGATSRSRAAAAEARPRRRSIRAARRAARRRGARSRAALEVVAGRPAARSSTARTTRTARARSPRRCPELAGGRDGRRLPGDPRRQGRGRDRRRRSRRPCARFVCTEIPPERDRGLGPARRPRAPGAGARPALCDEAGVRGRGDRRPAGGLGAGTGACPRARTGSRSPPARTTF